MQNLIKKFRQSSIVFERLGILSRKLKTWAKSNYHRVEYSLLTFCTRFSVSTYHCLKKGVRDFFLFGLDLELFAKIQNNLVSTQSLKLFSLVAQDLRKIKNIPNTFLQALLSRKHV